MPRVSLARKFSMAFAKSRRAIQCADRLRVRLRINCPSRSSAPAGALRRIHPVPQGEPDPVRASWPEPSKRGKEFSHWQLNPRLSRAFFAALSHVLHFGMGVAFAVYIVITLQNAVQTSPMHTDRMDTRRRRDLQRRRPAVLLSSRPFCHKKHPD